MQSFIALESTKIARMLFLMNKLHNIYAKQLVTDSFYINSFEIGKQSLHKIIYLTKLS